MPVERRLDPDTRILWTTLRGPITIQELRDHIDAVHGEGGNHFCEVVDTRDAEPQFSAKEFPALAAHGRRLLADRGMAARAVVVSPNDLMSFGLARIFAALVSPWVTVRVFDNMEAATNYVEALAEAPRRSVSGV